MRKETRLTAENTSATGMKKHCRTIFSELRRSLGIKRNVCFIPVTIPFSSLNGFTMSLGFPKKQLDLIFVNMWTFWRSYKKSPTLSWFNLFSVMAHELKHVKIMQDWHDGTGCEFGVLFSQWALDHIYSGFFPERIVRQYLLFKGASGLRRKRYAVSPIELLCYQYGYQEAFKRYCDWFNEDDLKIARTILDSVEFINRHMEIDYFSGKQAYNRFTHSLYYLTKSVKRSPGRVKEYPQLALIFTPEGLLKSPIRLFAERTEENGELIDSILVRMFITMTFDWEAIFESNQDLYNHICELSNRYCAEAIHYLKNNGVGEVFLHQSVLQDNAAMLIKNMSSLNRLMEKHHITRTSGGIVPLYYSDDFARKGDLLFS